MIILPIQSTVEKKLSICPSAKRGAFPSRKWTAAVVLGTFAAGLAAFEIFNRITPIVPDPNPSSETNHSLQNKIGLQQPTFEGGSTAFEIFNRTIPIVSDPKPVLSSLVTSLGTTCSVPHLFDQKCSIQADELMNQAEKERPFSIEAYFTTVRHAARQGSQKAQRLLFATHRLIKRDVQSTSASYGYPSLSKRITSLFPLWLSNLDYLSKLIAEIELDKIAAAGQKIICDDPITPESECLVDKDLFESAAKKGDGWSQYMMALYYLNLDSGSQSLVLEWLNKSAAQKIPEAEYKLAHLYDPDFFTPPLVKKSFEQALYYYERAAESGHSLAQFHLGLLLLEGNAIQRDQERGLKLITNVAEQPRNDLAMKTLSKIYAEGTCGVPINHDEAKKWKARAAKSDAALDEWIIHYYKKKQPFYFETFPGQPTFQDIVSKLPKWTHYPTWPRLP